MTCIWTLNMQKLDLHGSKYHRGNLLLSLEQYLQSLNVIFSSADLLILWSWLLPFNFHVFHNATIYPTKAKKKKIQKILDKQRKTILKKSIFHFNLPQHDFLWFGALPITKTVRDGLLLLIQGTAHWWRKYSTQTKSFILIIRGWR